MNHKITFFTAEMTDNNYLEEPVCKFCMNSWHRIIDNMKKRGEEAEIKVYRYNDPEVLEFLSIYPHTEECLNTNRLNILADAFRVFILSRHPYYVWLDSDIYAYENVIYNQTFQLKRIFSIMSNLDDTQTFKDLFEIYMNSSTLKVDRDMYKELKWDNKSINCIQNYLHMYRYMRIMRQNFILMKTEEDVDRFLSNIDNIRIKCGENFTRTDLICTREISDQLHYKAREKHIDFKFQFEIIQPYWDTKLEDFTRENVSVINY